MIYKKADFDIGVTRTNGTSVGLMLVRDRNNRPIYSEFSESILAPQRFDGAPDISFQPPDRDVPIILDDLRQGYGQRIYDSDLPKKYEHTINGDGRFLEGFMLGPAQGTITKPSTPSNPTITDGGLELWDSNSVLTNWTFVEDTVTCDLFQKTTSPNEGTYYAIIWSSGGSGTGHFYQDVSSASDYAGLEVTYTKYVKVSAVNLYRIGINDGVTTTYSNYHTGGGAWEQLTVTKTLSIASTRLRIIDAKSGSADYSSANDAGFDGAATLTVTAITVGVQTAHAEFNDNLYQSFGRILAKLNSTTFDFVAYMPATITDMHVMNWSGTDYLYIAQGDSDDLIYMTTAEVFTSSASNERAYFFTGSPAILYGVKQAGGNKVRKATAVDTWADVTLVGNGYENHTDLLIAPDNNIIIGKENIPYYSDGTTDDQNPLMAHFKSLTSSTTCKNSLQAFGATYIQGGDQTLYEYKGTTGSATASQINISPANFMSGLSDFSGKIQALAADDVYLYAILNNSTKIEVMVGQYETVGGVTAWRWHGSLAEITLTGCEVAYVSNVTKKRLYICSTAAGEDMHYLPVTTKYGDITSDADYTFKTGGYLVLPWLHGNLKGDDKAWIKLRATMGHSFDADIYFNINYKLWGDSAYDATTIKMDGSASSMVETNFIDVSAKPVSPFMRLKITGVTDDTAKTPILERLEVFAIWRPTKRYIIKCVVLCDDSPMLKNIGHDKTTAAEIKEVLDEMAGTAWPVTMDDLYGTSITVNVLPDGIKYVPMQMYQKGVNGFTIVNACELTLQKVPLS